MVFARSKKKAGMFVSRRRPLQGSLLSAATITRGLGQLMWSMAHSVAGWNPRGV
jgi:hypothetical protein